MFIHYTIILKKEKVLETELKYDELSLNGIQILYKKILHSNTESEYYITWQAILN